jgi:hypothetical protein
MELFLDYEQRMATHSYYHLQGAPIPIPNLLNNSNTHSSYSFIFINNFKNCLCICSCFLAFETKPCAPAAPGHPPPHLEKLYAGLLQINLNVEDELYKSAQL